MRTNSADARMTLPSPPQTRSDAAAFTRLELLAVIGAVGLLLAVQLPLWANSREPGQKVACFNNLRRLGLAMLQFSAENGGRFPPRDLAGWPGRLAPRYTSTNYFVCPADPRGMTFGGPTPADQARRSYIYNGWNDYLAATGFPFGRGTNGPPEAAISEPAATILLGEKVSESGHFYFDYEIFGDQGELDQNRHFKVTSDRRSGGSNHAFADGSVRFLKYGEGFFPTNLWAVVPQWRTNFYFVP